MKTVLKAGAEFESLTEPELRHALHDTIKDWMFEATKGLRPIRFVGQGTIAANAVTVGPGLNNIMGPLSGFYWLVRRIAITGVALTTEATSLFVNQADALHLVSPLTGAGTPGAGYLPFGDGALILQGGENLVVASTGAIASAGTVTVSGAAIEIPAMLLHRAL